MEEKIIKYKKCGGMSANSFMQRIDKLKQVNN